MVKNKFLLMLVAMFMMVTSVKALSTDGEGNYLIGSVQDWKDFAAITNADATGAGANAVMTADIDLGTDQTNITPTWYGDYSTRHYHGIFDGQGHTLTVHYSGSNAVITPFGCTAGATIKNLHVAGSITSTYGNESHTSGLICNSAGDDVIQNVWVSADMTASGSGWTECGAFIGCNNCGSSTVTDCLFTGTLTTTGGNYNGCFVGYVHSGSTTTNNCLSTGTFTLAGSPNYVQVGTVNNSYVLQHTVSIPASMQTDATKLSDGTTTTALNNERTGDAAVWVQEGKQPMLKTFALQQDGDDYYLLGNVSDWKQFANIVNATPAAKAKMTADIDLGDDQTNIRGFGGIFDGQGHTLTINYSSNQYGITPFHDTTGATIKNLHVDGSITSTYGSESHLSGVIGRSKGTDQIINVWVSVDMTSAGGGWLECAAFIGCNNSGNSSISDCLFTGTITTTSGSYNGCFMGYSDNGTVTISNCLSTGTFTYVGGGNDFRGNHSNCYVKEFPSAYSAGVTQPTDENLSDGTTTTGLNNGRTGDAAPWGQYGDSPILKIFCADELTAKAGDVDGEYWTTYYNNKSNMVVGAGTTVYKVALGGTTVTPTAIADGIITKGRAVVLKSTSANVSLSYSEDASTDDYSGNDLLGSESTVDQDGTSSYYVLSKKTAGIGFYKLAEGVSIPAHKAYFKVAAGSRDFYGIDDDGTTGVKELKELRSYDNSYYDLQGRRILYPTKGLYIVNGKKVIIK